MQGSNEKPACAYLNTPVPEIILCRECGSEVEIWSDENEKVCKCGQVIKKEVSCADKG